MSNKTKAKQDQIVLDPFSQSVRYLGQFYSQEYFNWIDAVNRKILPAHIYHKLKSGTSEGKKLADDWLKREQVRIESKGFNLVAWKGNTPVSVLVCQPLIVSVNASDADQVEVQENNNN